MAQEYQYISDILKEFYTPAIVNQLWKKSPLYAVLKKNRKHLSINPSAREKAELLKDEFQRSMARLGPLRERIERTDQLIDAVVYRLYGLNEEEIGIVEGNAS